MRVSIFKNIKSIAPIKDTSVLKVLESIRSSEYKNRIGLIRVERDKTKRNELKSKLPYVTFCGTFTSRANSNLKIHSGFACLDFDNVVNLEDLRKVINKDGFTFASFVSPSGDGLKVLVKIPQIDNNNDYQDYYIELVNHYKKYHDLDEGTKDLARACYLSFDEDVFINSESELFTDKFYRPLPVEKKVINIPLTDIDEVAQRLDKWFTKRWGNSNRNNNLHAYARQMNAFGVDKSTCETYLFRYDIGGKQNEIQKLIDSAYKYENEFNTRHFEDTKIVNDIKNVAITGESVDKLKGRIKDIDFELVKKEFEEHKQDLKLDEFWYYTEKEQIKLASYRFLQYLEHNNIFKFYPDENSGTYLFVKNDKNFINVFEEPKIKDFVLSDLRSRGHIDAFELMANNTSNFNSNYLSMVSSIDVKFNRDTSTESYIYYQNAVVKTTKDSIEVLDYSDVSDLIWTNQVIKRDIQIKDESEGVFKTFIWKVSGKNTDRYYTLKSVIGYLMHSYQNEAKPKAIIFNDEMISEDIPNGGSGKGLIHRAIGHIKNIVIEDGKKFDAKGQFAYQKVNKDTQIFLMDDVPKHFNFESLFSIITEGMTIEKKGQDAYQIPFKESPKISITTNYTINGSGASHERRVFEVEIANYFNENLTPEMEFGHLFFAEWNETEWAKFDNFMIRCVQFFLKNGLVQSDKVNLKLRKFKNEVGTEFIEFMESQKLDGSPRNRKEFRDEFNKQYPNVAKYNTPQKFNKKVKDYCDFHNIPLEESKYNGVVCFYIGATETPEQDCPF
tara:strand:- start:6263 stop:8611 length:2349 start_codon:yes stop_codon:yes gene_type:complete